MNIAIASIGYVVLSSGSPLIQVSEVVPLDVAEKVAMLNRRESTIENSTIDDPLKQIQLKSQSNLNKRKVYSISAVAVADNDFKRDLFRGDA